MTQPAPMTLAQEARMTLALSDVREERFRQHAARGEQALPHALPAELEADVVALLRACRRLQAEGRVSWPAVLLEEACEAVLASGEERRLELVQVAAVAVQQCEALDREAAPLTASDVAAAMEAWPPPEDCKRWERMTADAWRPLFAAAERALDEHASDVAGRTEALRAVDGASATPKPCGLCSKPLHACEARP